MNKIFSSISLNPEDYPEYVELHLDKVSSTRELEAEAKELIAVNFPEALLRQFITNVHKWGGHLEYAESNLPMVRSDARPFHFISAIQALELSPPDIENALVSLMV